MHTSSVLNRHITAKVDRNTFVRTGTCRVFGMIKTFNFLHEMKCFGAVNFCTHSFTLVGIQAIIAGTYGMVNGDSVDRANQRTISMCKSNNEHIDWLTNTWYRDKICNTTLHALRKSLENT